MKEIEQTHKNIGKLTNFRKSPTRSKRTKIEKLLREELSELSLQKQRILLASK